jgi:mannose-6-phosphate isomerase
MKQIKILKNKIQDYLWGSATAIPEFLGTENPTRKPQAEIWMGAHPKAPSLVNCNGQWRSLQELIEENPGEILGEKAAAKFYNQLPYLFKVLAVAKPLSIQAHPNRIQAQKGFERENIEEIPIEAPNRNYKDQNHKPECICALSTFWALAGFRNIAEIVSLTEKICSGSMAAEIEQLRQQQNSLGLKRFFIQLTTMDAERQKRVIDEALQNAPQVADDNKEFQWMLRLAVEYPRDIGIFAPIILNLVQLQPAQALFLPAGELHAYLEGFGIELMANSDNVLRGGLTSKHIDMPELLQIIRFEPRDINIRATVPKSPAERVYDSPADEFQLSAISVTGNRDYQSAETRSAEILLCTDGRTYLQDSGSQDIIELTKGISVIIPASVKSYSLSGHGTLFKASVPIL